MGTPAADGVEVDPHRVAESFMRRLEAALDQAKGLVGDMAFDDPETEF